MARVTRKNVSKTSITVRLDSIVLQEIDSKCNTEYCRSDFIKSAINDALNPKYKPIPTMKVKKVSYDDGKTWYDLE